MGESWFIQNELIDDDGCSYGYDYCDNLTVKQWTNIK